MTDFYTASGSPATSSSGASATMRSEFASIQAAFALVAPYTGRLNQVVHIDAAGTSQTSTAGFSFDGTTLTAPGMHSTGTLTVDGHVNLEGITSTGATGSGKLVFSNSPALVTPALGTPASGVLTNCTGTAAGLTAGNATTAASATTAVSISTVTTKGDLYVGGVSGAASRLAAGSDGQYPNYDSTASNGMAAVWPAQAPAVGRNITARTNSSTPNTKLDVAADQVVVRDANGAVMVLAGLAVTIDCGTTGAAGMDTGSQPANGWVYAWAIAKPDGTKSAIASISTSAPTMPSGYTYKALISAAYSNGSAFRKFRQGGNEVKFEARQSVLAAGTNTAETSQSVSTTVPPIALEFTLSANLRMDSTAGGFASGTGTIRYIAGSDYHALEAIGNFASDAGRDSAVLSLPNVSQQFYYQMSSNGSINSNTLIAYVLGFKLPLGGE